MRENRLPSCIFQKISYVFFYKQKQYASYLIVCMCHSVEWQHKYSKSIRFCKILFDSKTAKPKFKKCSIALPTFAEGAAGQNTTPRATDAQCR